LAESQTCRKIINDLFVVFADKKQPKQVFFVCLFFCHLFISLTIYDGTEGCVAGLVDWMTSWSFTNPL